MITEILSDIQSELKAPKNQLNKFGGYNYRNCEDILEALKPLLAKHKAISLLSDEIVSIGNRFYVKATATLQVGEEKISVTAFAREEDSKKGMDSSQLTGSTSSYARKYALNGLYAIDDTKDADTPPNDKRENIVPDMEKGKSKPLQSPPAPTGTQAPPPPPITATDDMWIENLKREINEQSTKIARLTGVTKGYVKKTAITVTNCTGETAEDLHKIKSYIENWVKAIESGNQQ